MYAASKKGTKVKQQKQMNKQLHRSSLETE